VVPPPCSKQVAQGCVKLRSEHLQLEERSQQQKEGEDGRRVDEHNEDSNITGELRPSGRGDWELSEKPGERRLGLPTQG